MRILEGINNFWTLIIKYFFFFSYNEDQTKKCGRNFQEEPPPSELHNSSSIKNVMNHSWVIFKLIPTLYYNSPRKTLLFNSKRVQLGKNGDFGIISR